MNFGKAVKSVRKRSGLTQSEAGVLAGLSQTALSQIESGKRPSEATLQKLSQVFKVPIGLFYVLAMEKEEVPPEKRLVYDTLFPIIIDLLTTLVTPEGVPYKPVPQPELFQTQPELIVETPPQEGEVKYIV